MFPIRIYAAKELPLGARCLHPGCTGRDVASLQRFMAEAGYPCEIDGVYGVATEETVRKIQFQAGLAVDGKAGPETVAALRALVKGTVYLAHRARPGETEEEIACSLGLAPEAMRRQNHLRRKEKIVPGALLRTRPRAIVLEGEDPVPQVLRYSGRLGPVIVMEGNRLVPQGEIVQHSLPIIRLPLETWRFLLGRPQTWPGFCANLQPAGHRTVWQNWCLELPSMVWRQRRFVLRFLACLARETGGPGPMPLLRPPADAEPQPDLKALSDLSEYLILDPGFLSFHAGYLARFIRQAAQSVPAPRLVLALQAGGLLRPAQGEPSILSVREARAVAVMAHTRFVWDTLGRIWRAVRQGTGEAWELSLLEERGLRERARLIDKLNCGGMVLKGFGQLPLPPGKVWPGEFAVLDSFPPPWHID